MHFSSLYDQTMQYLCFRFLNINYRFPGSTHDVNVMSNSNITGIMANLPNVACCCVTLDIPWKISSWHHSIPRLLPIIFKLSPQNLFLSVHYVCHYTSKTLYCLLENFLRKQTTRSFNLTLKLLYTIVINP